LFWLTAILFFSFLLENVGAHHVRHLFLDHLILFLKENCLYTTIPEQTKDKLLVRISCPGSDDIELSIHLAQWSLDSIPDEAEGDGGADDGEEETELG
jgi:hypothetical protein